MPARLSKIQTILAVIGGSIAIIGSAFAAYNHFAKQSDHEALAAEVKENYAEKEDILAMTQQIQQSNLDFWIYKTKQEIHDLQQERRQTNDPNDVREINEQIEDLRRDLDRYQRNLEELKLHAPN